MTRRSRHRRRPGFTLLDLLVTIAVIVVATSIVAPNLSDDSQWRLMAAARIVRSDIEMAQVLNITFPDAPVVVRFDAANRRYWLALAESPDAPIAREDNGRPYLVDLGLGRASSATGVTFTVADAAGDAIQFNAMGCLDVADSPSIELGLSGRSITLTVTASTGTITESN